MKLLKDASLVRKNMSIGDQKQSPFRERSSKKRGEHGEAEGDVLGLPELVYREVRREEVLRAEDPMHRLRVPRGARKCMHLFSSPRKCMLSIFNVLQMLHTGMSTGLPNFGGLVFGYIGTY